MAVLRYIFGVWLALVLISSALNVMDWWHYLNATPEQKMEYWTETRLKRNCEQEYIDTPTHFSRNFGSREEQIAHWQKELARQIAQSCAEYEQFKAISPAKKTLIFFLNISSGLVWLVITILGYRAYKKYQRKNDPHSLEDGESEVTNQAIDDLMKHYQNDLDKRK